MSVIYSEIKTILPGNWSIITPPNNVPAVGDWRERQTGVGSESQFVIEVYTETGWETKQVIAQ